MSDDVVEVKKSERLLKLWFLIAPIGFVLGMLGLYGIYDSVDKYWIWGISGWLGHRETLLAFKVIGVGVIVTLIPFGMIWLARRTKYQLTQHGVEMIKGVVSQRTITVPYRHIRLVGMLKRDIDRLFGTGVITIESAGNAMPEISLKGIERPDMVKQLIEERING